MQLLAVHLTKTSLRGIKEGVSEIIKPVFTPGVHPPAYRSHRALVHMQIKQTVPPSCMPSASIVQIMGSAPGVQAKVGCHAGVL